MTELARVRTVAATGGSVWWLNGVLAHLVAPDEGVRHLTGTVSIGPEPPVSWLLAIGGLRSRAVSAMELLVVEPGDPLGLPGPADVTRVAVAAGVAVISSDGAWTFVRLGQTARWQGLASTPRPTTASPLGTTGEARTLMRTAMAELTASFTSLDPDDDALAEVASLRNFTVPEAPPTVDPRTAQLADTALRVWWLTGIAERLCQRRGRAVPEQVKHLQPLARRAVAVAFSERPG